MNDVVLEMSDGFLISVCSSQPEGTPVGHIHLLHGMAEHIDRYESFIQYLTGKGYIVTGHDHRGHGKTAELNGQLGYFAEKDGFDRVVQDVDEIVTALRKECPSPQFILFGHSMGSFIGRRYLQLHGAKVDLAIFSGTGGNSNASLIAASTAANISGKVIGFDQPNPFLNMLVFGRYNKLIAHPTTTFDWLTRDSTVVEKYINDPLCGFVPTTQFFIDLFDGLGKLNDELGINNVPKNLPILLFSGTDDPVGNNGKGVIRTGKQYDKAGVEDVTVTLFEGGRHEMLNETNKSHVFTSITNWIEKKS